MLSREEVAVRLLSGALRGTGADRGSPDCVTLQVKGRSMEPLLRDGDWVGIAPAEPRPGRIVLARTAAGELICHRVLARTEGGFRLAGDRSATWEERPREAILGVVRWASRERRLLRLDGWIGYGIDRLLAALQRRSHRTRHTTLRRTGEWLRRRLLTVRNLAWLRAGAAEPPSSSA
ncbi:MAG: hypothetical protein GY856_33975 [bacterium]|nr:hypothetical protein [bacterium]